MTALKFLILVLFYIIIPFIFIVIGFYAVCTLWEFLKNLAAPYKMISIPLLILNAVPACMAALGTQETFEDIDVEFWNHMMILFFLIEMLITVILCKGKGIWIGLIRFFAGTLAGVAVAAAILAVIAVFAVILFAFAGIKVPGSDRKRIKIIHNGEKKTLYEDNGYFRDPSTGELFTLYSEYLAADSCGKQYEVL